MKLRPGAECSKMSWRRLIEGSRSAQRLQGGPLLLALDLYDFLFFHIFKSTSLPDLLFRPILSS
jgi:hypothetical protein